MNVQVKSSNGIILVPVESRLMANRKIFIEGEIDADTACEFAKKVMILNSEDSQKPIDVLINSPGGEINSGMLIYDIIQASISRMLIPIGMKLLLLSCQLKLPIFL